MFAKKRPADLLARALERDGQRLLVGAVDDLAHAVVLDVQQVVEHEHQVADRDGHLGRTRFDAFERRLADAAVETVEQLRHGADAAVLLARGAAERLQPLVDDVRDAADDLRRDFFDAGHAHQHVGAQLVRQLRRAAPRAPGSGAPG